MCSSGVTQNQATQFSYRFSGMFVESYAYSNGCKWSEAVKNSFLLSLRIPISQYKLSLLFRCSLSLFWGQVSGKYVVLVLLKVLGSSWASFVNNLI